jgi:hypothetical protein
MSTDTPRDLRRRLFERHKEATLQPAPIGKERVSDALYAEVATYYDEKALATLMIAIGQINFFIALAVIGKPQPVGSLAQEQWD